jgi:hypothetical protein
LQDSKKLPSLMTDLELLEAIVVVTKLDARVCVMCVC